MFFNRFCHPIRLIAQVLCFVCVVQAHGKLIGEEMTAQSLLLAYVESIDQRHQAVSEALTVFKNREFDQARSLLAKAVEADPALPPAGILLTRMYMAANQPSLARAELDKVSLEHPDDPEAYLGNGELAVGEARYVDAELAFRKAAELSNKKKFSAYRLKNFSLRIRLGMAAVSEGRAKWDEVIRHLQPIFDEEVKNSEVASRLGRALFKVGKPKESLAVLQKSWDVNKQGMQRPEIMIGMLFQEAGEHEKAAQSIKIAAQRDKDGVGTQSFVVSWALNKGDLALAQASADRALIISNSSLQSRQLVALVSRYRRDFPAAREMLESIHLESPTNLPAVIELAIVLINLPGQEKTALEYAQVAVKLQPDLNAPAGRDAAITLAFVLHKMKAQAEAESIVSQTLSVGMPVGTETLYFAAQVLLAGDKNKETGMNLLEKVVESDAAFPGKDKVKALFEKLKLER
jgi:tetratricopeptide (TPR) repeat protein